MTAKSSEGSVDSYKLAAGDVYFIPRAFPDHIENLRDEETRSPVFFDRAHVRDIGFTNGAGTYPRRVLAPTAHMATAALPLFPPMPSDLLIVENRNPDP
jgi:oxalate decarboxylase